MAQFSYIAVNKTGEKVKGTLDAPNEAEVRVFLRASALRPVSINKASALEFDLAKLGSFGTALKEAEIILFSKQLAILVSSGVPLVQSLEIISNQAKSPNLRRVLLAVKEKITGGAFLWEALGGYKDSFTDIYISLIRAGEASGSLDAILKRLIKYIEDAYRLKKLVKSAMIYPIAVVSVGIIVVSVMLVFVIPKFEELLVSAGQKLPGPTQFVIDMSHFMQHYIISMLIVGAVLAVMIRRYVKTPEGSRFFDHAILKVPLFGGLLLKIGIARFARVLQTLLASGINILDALDICKDAIGNHTLADSVKKIRSEVETGKALSTVMGQTPIFPPMVVQMVTVGETTGNLDKMLDRVAEMYEEEVQNVVSNLTKLLEPIILVVLGGMVGGLMIAMYLPIFQMAGAVN